MDYAYIQTCNLPFFGFCNPSLWWPCEILHVHGFSIYSTWSIARNQQNMLWFHQEGTHYGCKLHFNKCTERYIQLACSLKLNSLHTIDGCDQHSQQLTITVARILNGYRSLRQTIPHLDPLWCIISEIRLPPRTLQVYHQKRMSALVSIGQWTNHHAWSSKTFRYVSCWIQCLMHIIAYTTWTFSDELAPEY